MTNEMLEVKMDLNGSLFTIKTKNEEGSLWEQVGSLVYQAGFPIPADITLSSEGKVAKEAVKDYPYFIRLEAGTQRNVFTLANDKRETIKVEVVKTQDRGYTTNIIQ